MRALQGSFTAYLPRTLLIQSVSHFSVGYTGSVRPLPWAVCMNNLLRLFDSTMGLVQGLRERHDIGKKNRNTTLVETSDGRCPQLGVKVEAPSELLSPVHG